MKFGPHIHVPLKMNCNNFGESFPMTDKCLTCAVSEYYALYGTDELMLSLSLIKFSHFLTIFLTLRSKMFALNLKSKNKF